MLNWKAAIRWQDITYDANDFDGDKPKEPIYFKNYIAVNNYIGCIKNTGLSLRVKYRNGRKYKDFPFYSVDKNNVLRLLSRDKIEKVRKAAQIFSDERNILDKKIENYNRASWQAKRYGKYFRNDYFIKVHLGIGGFKAYFRGETGKAIIEIDSIKGRVSLGSPNFKSFLKEYYSVREKSLKVCEVPIDKVSPPVPSEDEFIEWSRLSTCKKPNGYRNPKTLWYHS